MSSENLIVPDEHTHKKTPFAISYRRKSRRRNQAERIARIGVLSLLIGIALSAAGLLMLSVEIPKKVSSISWPSVDHGEISLQIQEKIDPDKIRRNLRELTAEAHLAGTAANENVASAILQKYQAAGLENVHTVEYEVLLSYPDVSKLNLLRITDNAGKLVYVSEGVSPPIVISDQSGKSAGMQWLAYSPNGTVTADVVFCGNGTVKDFRYLESQGISVKGKIALIRYGGTFRGNKIANAQKHGAVAALLYSDPAEVAPDGIRGKDIYPNKSYMPSHGVQRGTLLMGDGDPLSPLYASKSNLWKMGSIEKARADGMLPSILALPLSYTSAMEVLSRLEGPSAPPDWQGGLNVTYRLGPGFKDKTTATVIVNGYFERRGIEEIVGRPFKRYVITRPCTTEIRRIRNVIGYINGREEPERYVILGNHYDAWTYGAMDPNSGTAALAEVARATMQVVNETGWRPARTLMFAAWDAEEYGLIGSTEFVEEFAEVLSRRGVAYLNMDCIHGNQTIFVHSSPSLQDQVILAAQRIQNPRKDQRDVIGKTVFDAWLHFARDPRNPGQAVIPTPAGGSDQKAFLTYLGIPAVDFTWIDADKGLTYPLYHTLYETPFTVEHLIDVDNFAIHRALAQYWIELAVRLADAPTLPYSFHTLAKKLILDYVPDLATAMQTLNKTTHIRNGFEQLLHLNSSCVKFEAVTRQKESSYRPSKSDPLLRSRHNDKLITVERCFVNPRGAPGDASARHVLFSISSANQYSGRVMQQVYKVLEDMAVADEDRLPALGDELANQISIVHSSVLCAISAFSDWI